jgi:hypothetical protein
MKDATATMGAVLPDDVSGRDAVHVAVVSCVADEKLAAGQDVGFLTGVAPNGERIAGSKHANELIGIVDPFLKSPVWPNQRFWLFLYPRTITSLRHQWTHPAFPEDATNTAYAPPSQKLESEQWLRDFVNRSDCPDYETTLALAVNNHEDDYLLVSGSDAHGEIPGEFWRHVEIVTGRKIEKRPTYFSCSC